MKNPRSSLDAMARGLLLVAEFYSDPGSEPDFTKLV
jgi:hypothetical protein